MLQGFAAMSNHPQVEILEGLIHVTGLELSNLVPMAAKVARTLSAPSVSKAAPDREVGRFIPGIYGSLFTTPDLTRRTSDKAKPDYV